MSFSPPALCMDAHLWNYCLRKFCEPPLPSPTLNTGTSHFNCALLYCALQISWVFFFSLILFHYSLLCLVTQSCLTLCDPMDWGPPGSVHGDSPGKNTGVGWYALLQGVFPTQGLNPGLMHCWQLLYHLNHQGSPKLLKWVVYPFSRGSSQPRNWTGISCFAGGFFTSQVTREVLQTTSDFSPTLSTGIPHFNCALLYCALQILWVFSLFISIIVYYKILNIVPCAI